MKTHLSNTGIPRFTLLMWEHIKKHGRQKSRKSRLLSSTKGEENRIELQTALNRKSRKSKPRKSRNDCNENFQGLLPYSQK